MVLKKYNWPFYFEALQDKRLQNGGRRDKMRISIPKMLGWLPWPGPGGGAVVQLPEMLSRWCFSYRRKTCTTKASTLIIFRWIVQWHLLIRITMQPWLKYLQNFVYFILMRLIVVVAVNFLHFEVHFGNSLGLRVFVTVPNHDTAADSHIRADQFCRG